MSDQVKDEGGFVKAERAVPRFSLKRFLPRTLFARSLLILVTPIIILQVVTMVIFFDRHWTKVTSRLTGAVAGEITVIAEIFEDNIGLYNDERIARYVFDNLSLEVQYAEGQSLSEQRKLKNKAVLETVVIKALREELRSRLGARAFIMDFDFDEKEVRVDVQLERGVLRVMLPERRLFSSSGYIFLLWVFGSSLLLLAIAVLFMRNQIRPIRKLAVAAKRLGQGRDVPMFKPEGAREVRDASQAFMDMHRRIKRQVSQRTAMLAGVSHDLRTPLTRLKLQLAMMDADEAKEMQGDIAEMERMIDGYLDFVRGEGDEQTKLTDINALIGRVVDAAKRQEISVQTDLAEGMNARIRPIAFKRCLSNLVTNAGKYAENVWISAQINAERKLVIIVEDDGPGIPEDQYEEVFKPFYRLDASRNIDTGGVGLGLPIAMDVVHAHGGKILLGRSQHGGLEVTVRLPI